MSPSENSLKIHWGYVYAYQDQLYRQVKKHGEVRYLKCCIDPCDGSAKITQSPSSAQSFYRGLVNADAHGSALIFALDRQLQQLQSATSVFFDATFKVVSAVHNVRSHVCNG